MPEVSVEHVISRDDSWPGPRGRIDRPFLEQRLPRWAEQSDLPMVAYLCGPEAFMDVAESALMVFGLGSNDIRMESFDQVQNDDDDKPPVRVVSPNPGSEGSCETITAVVMGEEFEVAPKKDESILDALLRAGADVPFFMPGRNLLVLYFEADRRIRASARNGAENTA